MPDPTPSRPRILSGMRPTGRLHLGNYMGALKNWIDLQNQRDPDGQPTYDCFFFIADWHALTTDYADPSRLKQNFYEVALDFLSAGLDPQRSTLFIQSHVPQHAELHLLLSMITPLSWLERVPSYKDQQEQLREKDLATYGFLGYPLLQSADILLYRPKYVPVGADQVAHIEITREIARRFNYFYITKQWVEPGIATSGFDPKREQELLLEPEALLTPSPKLPGTDGRKMSKSYGNSILLTDPRSVVLEKTHGMTNGGQRPTQHDPGDPEICPVGDLHRIFSTPAVDQQIRHGCRTATIGCDECKHLAGLSISAHLLPIQNRREELEADSDAVWSILEEGSARARTTAEETMQQLRAVTGLSRDRSGVRVDRDLHHVQTPESARDLSKFKDWWTLETSLLNLKLREIWRKNLVPLDTSLKPESEGVWLTVNNRRVLVLAAAQRPGADTAWLFETKPKSYEILVLLCWQSDLHLRDFVIPQKLYVGPWAQAKRSAGKGNLTFSISCENGRYQLDLLGQAPIDITDTEADYAILR